ncbi:MAG: DUF1330 domain-containing protein [Acidimicrobiia bacterium]
MKFVQIIEYKTTKFDEVINLLDEWLAATEGKRLAGSSTTCRDRDNANTYVVVVEFPSYEEAMRNDDLPETQQFAEKMMAVCDGEPIFRNLDVVRQDEG